MRLVMARFASQEELMQLDRWVGLFGNHSCQGVERGF
jgi:hypothetical protein